MSELVRINPERIRYMLNLFKYTEEKFLQLVNKECPRVNALTRGQVFAPTVKLSHLKSVDKVLKRGLSFYTNPANIEIANSTSIFFRKQSFNAKLNLADRQIVDSKERDIIFLDALRSLSNFRPLARQLPVYSVNDNPYQAGGNIRRQLKLEERVLQDLNKSKVLSNFIGALSDVNILVLEFIEAGNKREKTSLDGFSISPQNIVIKKHTLFRNREILTLAHELGHLLLNEEEVDDLNYTDEFSNPAVENWCYNFAMALLVSERDLEMLHNIDASNLKVDDEVISGINERNPISRVALFTHLHQIGNMPTGLYEPIKAILDKESEAHDKKIRTERAEERKRLKAEGKDPGGPPARPIYSPLEKDIFRTAYFEGVIEEYDVLSRFRIYKNQNFEDWLYA